MWATSQSRSLRAIGSLVGVGGLAVALAGCGDGLGLGGGRRASVSFAVTPDAAASIAAAGIAALEVTGTNDLVVDVESIDIVFNDIKFRGRDDDPNDDEDNDRHHGDLRFRGGANTVSLPLEGGVITPFTGELPMGTFDRLKMTAEFARIKGTVNGAPFDVTVEIDQELEFELDPPVVVDETSDPVNVTIDIDIATWFKNAAGAVIDPRRLASDPVLRNEFRRRVVKSFKAFGDDDCDGHRDRHGDDDDDDDNDDHDNSGPGSGNSGPGGG